MAESSTATVFVDPSMVEDDSLQQGSTFSVKVNVSDVNDLFAWQVDVSWNSSILNITAVTFGDFLASQPNGTSSSAGYPAISLSNETGRARFAETTLGAHLGVNGSGWLASVEFSVVGYGTTVLAIDLNQTVLLDNLLYTIEFTADDGYFCNVIRGDFDKDKDVDPSDFAVFAGAYGTSPPSNPACDFDDDGDVDPSDFAVFAGNYGRSV